MNKTILFGALGQEPELRATANGNSILKIRMATTDRYKKQDGTWDERADWHDVVVFGARASGLAKILAKGSRILVTGKLRTSSYDAKDGSGKRYRTEVIADEIELAGGKGGGDSRGGDSRGGDARDRGASQPAQGGGYDDGDYGGGDDDIPF